MKKVVILVIIALLFSLSACGRYKSADNDNGVNIFNDAESIDMEPINVHTYLGEIGEVETVLPAKKSEEIKTGAEVVDYIDERGFGEYPITAEYTMDGEYLGVEMDTDDDGKHPFYETYYVSATGEIWTINVINGTITAYPVTYNIESERDITIILSESKELTSYDGVTNTFYSFVPDAGTINVVVVDRIDSKTLDKITKEEMDRY